MIPAILAHGQTAVANAIFAYTVFPCTVVFVALYGCACLLVGQWYRDNVHSAVLPRLVLMWMLPLALATDIVVGLIVYNTAYWPPTVWIESAGGPTLSAIGIAALSASPVRFAEWWSALRTITGDRGRGLAVRSAKIALITLPLSAVAIWLWQVWWDFLRSSAGVYR